MTDKKKEIKTEPAGASRRPELPAAPEDRRRVLIQLLQERAALLGRVPARTDMSPEEMRLMHKTFGKWCYALEEAGLKTPSQTTLARREHRTRKWKRKHRAARRSKGRPGPGGEDSKNEDGKP